MPAPNKPDLQALIDPLTAIAKEAGAAVMDVHQRGVSASTKQDGSPVTLADKQAEAIILEGLKRTAPDIPIVSEENTASHGPVNSDLFFLVDPLDGTKEFIRKDCVGSFTVNIALIHAGTPIFGVVYAPALDRLFWGGETIGAFENGRPITIRALPKSGSVALVSVSHMDSKTADWLEQTKISSTLAIGSSLKFCLLAAGEADVYPRFGPTMEWDTAAGDAILRAAGGSMTCLPSGDFLYGKDEFRNGPFLASGNWKE